MYVESTLIFNCQYENESILIINAYALYPITDTRFGILVKIIYSVLLEHNLRHVQHSQTYTNLLLLLILIMLSPVIWIIRSDR